MNDKSKYILNPFVVLIGIEDYDKDKTGLTPLDGVTNDIYRMAHLWCDIYKYKNMSIALLPNHNNSNTNSMKTGLESAKYKQYFNFPLKNAKSQDILSSFASLKRYLGKIASTINLNEDIDGLIFYYSGHGDKDGIILPNANKERYIWSHLMKIFDGDKCNTLINKPKIMIYDCCRGGNIAQTIKSVKPQKARGDDDWYDEYYHKNSGFATIFANFTGDKVNDQKCGGSLTRSIEQVFENPNQISTFSLRDLILGIRELTKRKAGKGNKPERSGAQLVDFHEAMEYNVYFKKND